jgi:predicted AlkP superfamily phosphohydrolase/phosphomutase
MPERAPVVVLGLDVGDVDALKQFVREGYLPAIASIMERGCFGTFGGPEMVCELGTWVSLASGVSRSKHGYHYFRQLKPGTYDMEVVSGLTVQNAPPFWAQLRQAGCKAAIIDVPDTRPVAGMPGLQVYDWATHYNILPPTAEPPELMQEVKRVFGPQIKLLEKLDTTFEADKQMYARLMDRVERKGRLCRHLFAKDKFDLVMAVFGETHTGGHQFWRYRPEAGLPESELTHAIRNLYQATDQQLALILKELPADANVIIVSATGLEDQYSTEELVEDFCRKLGYQASPPASSSISPMSLLRAALPEKLRATLSKPLPRSLQERWISDKYKSRTDWGKTTAFCIPVYYGGFIRVNLKGREPLGIVAPGAEYDALLKQLTADLRQLFDPVTNQLAVTEIFRADEIFHGGPPETLPDLFFYFQPAAHWLQRLDHPRALITQRKPDFFRGSDHTRTSFFAAAGPGIAGRGDIGTASPTDLAPTLLSLLNLPIPDYMDGKPIKSMLGI